MYTYMRLSIVYIKYSMTMLGVNIHYNRAIFQFIATNCWIKNLEPAIIHSTCSNVTFLHHSNTPLFMQDIWHLRMNTLFQKYTAGNHYYTRTLLKPGIYLYYNHIFNKLIHNLNCMSNLIKDLNLNLLRNVFITLGSKIVLALFHVIHSFNKSLLVILQNYFWRKSCHSPEIFP